MRYYLRVRVGWGFGLINLVLLHSEYLYSFFVEPFVGTIVGGINVLVLRTINGSPAAPEELALAMHVERQCGNTLKS